MIKGYKATDKDMKCRGYQFTMNTWHEHEGELITCGSGFHFCDQPSGPWAYYNEKGTRVFEVEVDDVLAVAFEPGADFKRVCRRIKFVKEITPPEKDGQNTGDSNTGDSNTGYWNATNFSSGMFCAQEPKLVIFDKQTKLTRDQFFTKYPEAYELGRALFRDAEISLTPYKRIPGITKAKLKALHKKFIEGRRRV